MISLAIFATSLAVVSGLALLTTIARLTSAAALQNGHPMANKIRSLLDVQLNSYWRLAIRLDSLIAAMILMLFIGLAIYYG